MSEPMSESTKQAVRIRPDIAAMAAYTPTSSLEMFGERLGLAPCDIVKLDANENPYGASPSALAALSVLEDVNIYPDPTSSKLRVLLSAYVGVDAAHILVGAGADELIARILELFIEPGDAVINCPPTFGMYAFDAPLAHARVIEVPRRADFALDVDGIEAAVRAHAPKLLFACSPNNPDGSLIPPEVLDRLLALPVVVVVDEAYIEFSGAPSAAPRVPQLDNLIVLRTFSKWAGLAGLRVGYGIFPLDLMPHLWKIKQPYNLNVAADFAARASLLDVPELFRNVALLVAERERMERELALIPFLRPYPSRSNFVLCRVTGMAAPDLRAALEQRGILVRYYNTPGLDDHIRISAGTPDQTDRLLAALREIGMSHD